MAELENEIAMNKASNSKFIFLIFAILAFKSIAFTQTNQTKEEKIKLAGEAGDQVVKRFRETLDFGIVFDEMASKKARKILEKFASDFGSIDKSYFEKQTAETKELIFKSELNSMYLGAAFMLTFLNERDKTKPDFYLPPGYFKLVKSFKFLNGFSEDPSRKNKLPIQNDKDLGIYLEELAKWNKFLRKHLPRKFFTLRRYKKNLKDPVLEPKEYVGKGDSYFKVPEGVDVFGVVRDMFSLVFIEEDGKMKILGIIIGD